MLGDVLLISDKHIAAAAVIAERVMTEFQTLLKEHSGHKYIVAISGESGSGKSELSHSLAIRLKKEGVRPKILHTDNYYRVPPSERLASRLADNFEHVGVSEYDWDLLKSNIADFRSDRQSLMPCVDIVSGEIDRLITDFSKADVLVVDGLYALGIRDADLCVYIDLTWRETKKNQTLRGKEANDTYRLRVLEKEHDDISAFRYRAHLIVGHDYSVTESLDPGDAAVEGDYAGQ